MFPISDSIRSNKFPLINVILVIATSYVFLRELFSSNLNAFIAHYALIPSTVTLADTSTLFPFVSAIFLHGGWLHILSNMWFLWVFGDDVEAFFGHFFYLVLYIFSGVVGNVVQFLLIPHSSIPMLGASGAIAGVLGAYFVLFPYSKVKTLFPIFFFFTIIDIPAPFMLGYWFFLQLISGAASIPFMSTTGGVAFFAHVGGFTTGALVGAMARIMRRFSV